MTARPKLLLLTLCLASLAGWAPLRSLEQLPAPLLELGEAWLARALPGDPRLPDAVERAHRRQTVRAAWEAWVASVSSRPPPAETGVECRLVPVLSVDMDRGELRVAVPPSAVRVSTPVTWRGVLLGFVRPWRNDGERVDREGEAKVALLGHPLARPVAARWQSGPRSAAVHFLLTAADGAPRIEQKSRPFAPRPGQLAYTRDVSSLGDDLPAGLLLGQLGGPDLPDQPGGGLGAGEPGDGVVESLVDARHLGHVTLEVPLGVSLPCPGMEARLVCSGSTTRVRIDRGSLDGVKQDDEVFQDGVFVGRVETAGPFSSLVRRGQPRGMLLLLDEDGELVGTPAAAAQWPEGWRPAPGQVVATGHRELGGARVGVVASVTDQGMELRLDPVDPSEPVLVVAP